VSGVLHEFRLEFLENSGVSLPCEISKLFLRLVARQGVAGVLGASPERGQRISFDVLVHSRADVVEEVEGRTGWWVGRRVQYGRRVRRLCV
jgi:hypothetical protein